MTQFFSPPCLRFGSAAAGLLLIVCAARLAAGQTNDDINAGIQFNFAVPGARSLGMGNAFVGLADDATAAYANPAGLLWLSKPEVSLEGRYWNHHTYYGKNGSFNGVPTGKGHDKPNDPNAGLKKYSAEDFGFSFLSAAFVLGEDARLAVYRHVLADFSARIDDGGGTFLGGPGTRRFERGRIAGIRGNLDLDIVDYGVSTAYRMSDRVWVGGGLSVYEFALDAVTHRYDPVVHENERGPYAPIDYTPSNETDRHYQKGNDVGFGVNVGALVKSRRNRWAAGAVYRRAPAFDFDTTFEWGEKALRGYKGGPGFGDPSIPPLLSGSAEFRTPDVLGAGFMVRPFPELTLSFEYDRVGYSRLKPRSNLHINVTEPWQLKRFTIRDADELHAGAEYVFGRSRNVALRAGVSWDPDHQLYFDFKGDKDSLPVEVDRLAARFPRGDNELHVAGGVGFTFPKPVFQVDLGFDLSDRADVISLSTVVRF